MAGIELTTYIELLDQAGISPGGTREPENWYAEPFTKRTGCKTPGQCGGDCNCGCPYNTMTEVERLPLIEDMAGMFPNEWLAFIISPAEDEEYEPVHGKLIAHSPHPDEVYDAVNAVLWNQHVYVYFNGIYETMKASYGSEWVQPSVPVVNQIHAGPQPGSQSGSPPDDLTELIYSALDQLYDSPKLNEAIRRLRLARVRSVRQGHAALAVALDTALDMLETPRPVIEEVIWQLEEALVD